MKSSVITFPGSNCDRDMDVALNKFGFKNKMVWHDDNELPKSDLVVLPGGFSYGDYLRCGSMASKSKIMQSVINFAKSGGLVMGICNGFQILVETGLVPGVLLRNKYLEFICKNVFVKVDNKENPYFKNLDKEIFEFHIAHNEGNYFCTKEQLKEIYESLLKIKTIAGLYESEKNPLEVLRQVLPFDFNLISSSQVDFFCRCSKDSFKSKLITLGTKELISMQKEGHDKLVCQYCNSEYKLDDEDFEQIIEESRAKRN